LHFLLNKGKLASAELHPLTSFLDSLTEIVQMPRQIKHGYGETYSGSERICWK